MGWAACLGESMIQLPRVGRRLLACENGASPDYYYCCCFGDMLTKMGSVWRQTHHDAMQQSLRPVGGRSPWRHLPDPRQLTAVSHRGSSGTLADTECSPRLLELVAACSQQRTAKPRVASAPQQCFSWRSQRVRHDLATT